MEEVFGDFERLEPQPKKEEDKGLPYYKRFCMLNSRTFKERQEPICDCEKCLMMCETHCEYRVTNKALGLKGIEMDDEWMLYFGCEGTRDL